MATLSPPERFENSGETPVWSFRRSVGFRLCFVYFGLYCLLTQILTTLFPIPGIEIPDFSTLWPTREMVVWAAKHIFRATTPLVITGSGSGDKTFDWVLVFCLLVIAAIATTIWSLIKRREKQEARLYKWFHFFMRISLAGQMFVYGFDKVVPMQMPYPYLTKLVEPFGHQSPMGLLWSSIGAATGYEVFAGCAELLGGILLIFPRTAILGALVCLADMTNVFVLNMTYDVPVKLFSFQLILLALLLLAPEARRLFQFFFLNRTTKPSSQPELFKTQRARRIWTWAQAGFWILFLTGYAQSNWSNWHTFGGGRPKSALYGIWDIEQLKIDGQVQPPLRTNSGQWRRGIFDFPERAAFQQMDDSFAQFRATIDTTANTLTLRKQDDGKWAQFKYQRNDKNLSLDGEMDGHKMQMQLRLLDREKFLLVNRGFHWIQEYPFNR